MESIKKFEEFLNEKISFDISSETKLFEASGIYFSYLDLSILIRAMEITQAIDDKTIESIYWIRRIQKISKSDGTDVSRELYKLITDNIDDILNGLKEYKQLKDSKWNVDSIQ